MDNVFLCRRCGYCCHGETTVSLDKNDQEKMLNFLKISRSEARKYWRVTGEEVQMKTVNGHCIFWEDGCTVHQARPWRCREWPLVKAILIDRSNLESIRTSCPGLNIEAPYNEVCRVIEEGGCLSHDAGAGEEERV